MRQCGQLQGDLQESLQQRHSLQNAFDCMRVELDRAHQTIGQFVPDQQQQQQQQREKQELEDSIQMLRVQLSLQEHRAAAELVSARESCDACIAYLEARSRSTIEKMALRIKVRRGGRAAATALDTCMIHLSFEVMR
jgi:uncharacterized caspase-like protein